MATTTHEGDMHATTDAKLETVTAVEAQDAAIEGSVTVESVAPPPPVDDGRLLLVAPISPLFPSPSSAFFPPPAAAATPSTPLLVPQLPSDEQPPASPPLPASLPPPASPLPLAPTPSSPTTKRHSTPLPRPSSSSFQRPASISLPKRSSKGPNRSHSRSSSPLISPALLEGLRNSFGPGASWLPAPVKGDARELEKERVVTRGGEGCDIVVRDFAYAREDLRFWGGKVEISNERREDDGEAQEEEQVTDEDGTYGGSSAYSWGFVTSHTTDFPPDSTDSLSLTPSSEPSDLYASPDALLLAPFIPGTYTAIYAFTPESSSEMRIERGDTVEVYSRQCAGWVQAGRVVEGRTTGEEGLVPENYLALLAEHEWVEEDGVSELGEDEELHEGPGELVMDSEGKANEREGRGDGLEDGEGRTDTKVEVVVH